MTENEGKEIADFQFAVPPRGPGDYIEIAKATHIVFSTGAGVDKIQQVMAIWMTVGDIQGLKQAMELPSEGELTEEQHMALLSTIALSIMGSVASEMNGVRLSLAINGLVLAYTVYSSLEPSKVVEKSYADAIGYWMALAHNILAGIWTQNADEFHKMLGCDLPSILAAKYSATPPPPGTTVQ